MCSHYVNDGYTRIRRWVCISINWKSEGNQSNTCWNGSPAEKFGLSQSTCWTIVFMSGTLGHLPLSMGFDWADIPWPRFNNNGTLCLTITQVDWNEVNAALGEITLLLVSVGFNFTRYILVPQGSHSKLKSADDSRQQYHLYIDESFSLLPRRNFNQAISALLVCAEELGNFVANQDPVLRYPYLIQNSQIDSLSCLHSTHEETWTRSLKFLLTDMKWTIMWVAKHTVNNIIEDDI